MAKRKKIALIYSYNENWIGGTYYIENLILALSCLSENQQPELLVFITEESGIEKLKQNVKYTHWSFYRLEHKSLPLYKRFLNKLTDFALGRRFIGPVHIEADLVFPLPTAWRYFFASVPKHLYWIPDFQEHFLPAFFQPQELIDREANHQLVLKSAKHIIFSSYAAQNDFNIIYPENKLAQHVLQFAVDSRSIQTGLNCLATYSINRPYFICSNQFWRHKNHALVLRAIEQVKHEHPEVLVVFTGKEFDHRNPDYFDSLVILKEELSLDVEVKFLGFIPRQDQLALMQNSIAVIQPSLFEGWSTVIEDAKSLSIPLLVSDLDVHREQLTAYESKLYFSPDSVDTLSQNMVAVLEGELPRCHYDYHDDFIRFGNHFMNIIQVITSRS